MANLKSITTGTARTLATTTKTTPYMGGITPRWLLKLLPWVNVMGGTYRVNRCRPASGEEKSNSAGEHHIPHSSGHEGELEHEGSRVQYHDAPVEYPLDIVQTVMHLHTRVSDLYSYPHDQLREQLRLTTEALKERQEYDIINHEKYGLLNAADDSMRVETRSGGPTPDDMDELLSKVWKQPSFFLANPKAIEGNASKCQILQPKSSPAGSS